MTVEAPSSTESATALIAGVTGLVGQWCLKSLLQSSRYDKVIALTRRELSESDPKLEQRVVNFDQLSDELADVKADDVFCCLGTTMKKAGSKEAFRKVDYEYCVALGEVAKRAGAKHFLLVSAVGASASSPIFYSRTKGETERALKQLDFDDLSIFHPSMLVGDRSEQRMGETVGIWFAKITDPLWRGPLTPYRGIDARDVANAMVNAAVLKAREPESEGCKLYSYRRIQQLVNGQLPD